jgi:hypothetical protein
VSTPTSVYRYFDLEGRIIYVGVTSRGPQRQAQHAVTADWWPYVSTQDVEHLPTREAALKREKWLIEHHRPPFNRQHNPAHEKLRAAYLRRLQRAITGACEFDGAVECDEGDDCVAFMEGVNDKWCGVPRCVQCHRVWHEVCCGNEHGVEWDEVTFATDLAAFCGNENVAVACAAFDLVSALQRMACALEDTPGATLDPDWPARLRRRIPSSQQIVDYAPPTVTTEGEA